jgi:hypothetical protein
MGDMGQRFWRHGPRLLGQGAPLVAVACIAAFNGSLQSPAFDSVSYYVSSFARGSYVDILARSLLLSRSDLYQNLTWLLIALMTLLIAGIPAALYERLRGLKASTPVSLGIWLASALLISLPTILRMFAGDEW